MGYSARYHAASLAAVFLALVIGTLIGAGLGGDVVSGTAEDLERSLSSDLAESQARVEELGEELDRQREFAEAVYPALVGDRLQGHRIAIIGLGELGEAVAEDIEAALAPTGARLGQIAVVREQPDLRQLRAAVPDPQLAAAADGGGYEEILRRAGRQLVTGGRLLDALRERLLARSSGVASGIDGVIVVDPPTSGDAGSEARNRKLRAALLEGLRRSGEPIVGVERSDASEGSSDTFSEHGITSVDSVDLTSGRVALVFGLLGAQGNFGVKDSADRLVPDLLSPGGEPPGDAG